MDVEKTVQGALDSFENDNFTDAKDAIKGIIKSKINSHLKDKLKLDNDIEPKPKSEPEKTDDVDDVDDVDTEE